MPPARRARLSSWPHSSVAAVGACSRGWLSVRRKASKRPRRADTSHGDGSDGTPLADETLVSIFADLSEMTDLVSCAFTCRRWLRLVSSEAAFICRTPRQPGRFVRCLALGFFHQDSAGAVPRFAPMSSAARVLGLRRSSLNTLVEGLDDGLFDRSRLVASRNGLLVVHLRSGERALKLCICNPMTGEVNILPPITGKDRVGNYACTVLTADDHGGTKNQRCSPSAYRLLLVYNRRGFTASRSYTSESGSWSPEARVTNAKLTNLQMKRMRAGVVVGGGKVVCWHAKNLVLALSVDTLQARTLCLPSAGRWPRGYERDLDESTLLGVSPEGTLSAIQIRLRTAKGSRQQDFELQVSIVTGTGDDMWEAKESIRLEELLPDGPGDAFLVKLRWFCEKSGVVLYTVGTCRRTEVYALSLKTKEVEKVASHEGCWDWDHGGRGSLYGYEMDRATFLASLGEGDDAEERLIRYACLM